MKKILLAVVTIAGICGSAQATQWVQVFSDSFTRANTAAGGVANGWTDTNSVWFISANTVESNSTSFGSDFLFRPSTEVTTTDMQAQMKAVIPSGIFTPLIWIKKSSNNGYVAWHGISGTPILSLGKITGGSLSYASVDDSSVIAGSSVTITLSSIGTTQTATIALSTSPTVIIATITQTDSSFAANTGAGMSPLSGPNQVMTFASFSTSTTVSSNFTIFPTSAPVNVVGTTITVTGSNTNWIAGTPGVPTFAVSSGTITSQVIISSVSATFLYHSPSSNQTVTVSNSSDTATASLLIYTPGVTPSMTVTPSSVPGDVEMTTITLAGSNTGWTPGTPGSPTFTVNNGAFAQNQTVVNATTTLLYVWTPRTAQTITVTDPLNSITGTFNVTLPVVTGNILAAGNSLTNGYGSTGGNTYPAQMAVALGPKWSYINSGVNGQTGTQILADYTNQIGNFYDPTLTYNVCVIWEITNDIYYNNGPTAAYNNIVAISTKAIATGYKVVVVTGIKYGADGFGSSALPGTSVQQKLAQDTYTNQVNTQIRLHWREFANAIVDLAADDRLIPPSVTSGNIYYFDAVHMNNAGYGLIANEIFSGVNSALIQPPYITNYAGQ